MSIYNQIVQLYEENRTIPYMFQNPHTTGRKEITYVMWHDELADFIKEQLASELVDLLVKITKGQEVIEKLESFLTEKPVYLYLTALSSRIKLFLEKELFLVEELHTLAMNLALESDRVDKVKLGIILLGFYENDLVKQILKTLGYHSEFTLYVVEAAKQFAKRNEFFEDLLRNCCGYGRIVALYMFTPIKEEEKEWLFIEGVKNSVAPNLSAMLCFNKIDMMQYLEKLEMTNESFSHASYILAYVAENNPIFVVPKSSQFVKRYIDAAEHFAYKFIDLAALAMLEKSFSPSQEEFEIADGWTFQEISKMYTQCQEIIRKISWKKLIDTELYRPFETTSLTMKVIEHFKLVPSFNMLASLLENDPFDMDVLHHVLIEYPHEYLADVYHYLKNVLPVKVQAKNPLAIMEEDFSEENKPDIWLVFLLKALRRAKQNKETLFLQCVTARFPDVRIAAIQALRTFKQQWSEEVQVSLNDAYENEPVSKIKAQLARLIGKNNDNMKEQRYVDVSSTAIVPSSNDIFILDTQIAGTFYRDLEVVDGLLELGDILYLIREPENKYDDNAIIVATDDGYMLGYIPRTDNDSIATMLDNGDKLYAILLTELSAYGKPKISIYLNRTYRENGKVVEFRRGNI